MELRVGAWLATLAVAYACFALITRAPRDEGAVPPLQVDSIAREVERQRGLRFEELPDVVVVSRKEAAAASRRQRGTAAERAELQRLGRAGRLAGLVAAEGDLADLLADEFSAGFYDEQRGIVALVEVPWGNRPYYETVLAHELTHALEDQRLPAAGRPPRDFDEKLASDAFAEGSAMLVERAYAREQLDAGQVELVERAWRGAPPSKGGALVVSGSDLLYESGARYADRVLRQAGCGDCGQPKRWRPMNAQRARPPLTTAAILHPRTLRPRSRPARLPTPGDPGAGWSVEGELPAGEQHLLAALSGGRLANPLARDAARGWRGGRMALFARGAPGCPRVCRHDRALSYVLGWSSARDAREFATAAPSWFESEQLEGRPLIAEGSGDALLWRLPEGAVGMRTEGRITRIAFGPNLTLVGRMLSGR